MQPSQFNNSTPQATIFPFANEMLSPSTLNYSSTTPAFNVQEHLTREMFGWGKPGNFNPPAKENITNFLLVPYELECFLTLGLCVCIDSFLYMLSFLPLRVFLGFVSLLQELVLIAFQRVFHVKFGVDVGLLPRFHRTQAFDLMRGLMLIIAILILRLFRLSEWYHFIRGQGVIKLYVLTSMIEVLDKLLSCLGQDIFDALHRQVRRHPVHTQTLIYFLASTVYVCLHACMYFFQVATYMVVVNSADEALITVLILNNFSELRGFVFKKLDANNLFQLACADAAERFQILLFLSIILMISGVQGSGTATPRIVGLMLTGEALADAIKHAFMNKFNGVNASVYRDFAFVLRSDLLNVRRGDTVVLDHTYGVARRLGLAQIPLAAVAVRYLLQSLQTPTVYNALRMLTWQRKILCSLAICLSLLVVKAVIGVALAMYADQAQRRDTALLKRTPLEVDRLRFTHTTNKKQQDNNHMARDPDMSPTNSNDLTDEDDDQSSIEQQELLRQEQEQQQRVKDRLDFMEELANIERYTVYKGRIL